MSLCSQVLLLPLGVPMPLLACFTPKYFQDSQIWRVLTTTDVGNGTQGQGFRNTKSYPSNGAQHFQAFCFFGGTSRCLGSVVREQGCPVPCEGGAAKSENPAVKGVTDQRKPRHQG